MQQAAALFSYTAPPPGPPRAVRDIDFGEEGDPILVSEYAPTIYKNLLRDELQYRPDGEYMTAQSDINSNMRGILVDWLVEVAEEYKLHAETLFLSINYIDRFLSKNDVQRGELQLVGITCMLVAAKYEEIYPPSVDDFVYISDNAYAREQVIKQEVIVLNSLGFHCTVVTARQFLRRFAKAARADHTTHELSHFFAELTLVESQYMQFRTSVIAASAMMLAMQTTQMCGDWDATMQFYAGYTLEDLTPCATAMLKSAKASYDETSTFKAVRDKYNQPKFDRVSHIQPCQALPPPSS